MRTKILTLLLVLLISPMLLAAEEITPDEITIYKQTPERDLSLHIFYPDHRKAGEKRAAVISFFGGGWVAGSPIQFYAQSQYYASLGMVAISADYRLIGRDKTTPFEAVMDAKSAVRWVRKNCKELGIDPNKIVTSGGSAGGHLAACTALIEGCEDDPKQRISSSPNAMILFNPVINTTKDGYGADKLVGEDTTLSPVHHVRKNLPPTLIMHGTQDTTVPYKNAVEFTEKMKQSGNECTLISAFGENHGFFNGTFRPTFGMRNFNQCMAESAKFLSNICFIETPEVIKAEPIRIACLGNSITFGHGIERRMEQSYPAKLQEYVGERYEVRNFGKSGANVIYKGNLPYIKSKEYKELTEFEPDVIIIKLGTNDSKAKNWQYKEDFTEDFTALIKSLKKSAYRSPQIYVCTPVPSFTPKDVEFINSRIIEEEICPAVKEVAKKNRVTLIDLFGPFERLDNLFPDDIHPNAEGAERIAKIIYNSIAQENLEL